QYQEGSTAASGKGADRQRGNHPERPGGNRRRTNCTGDVIGLWQTIGRFRAEGAEDAESDCLCVLRALCAKLGTQGGAGGDEATRYSPLSRPVAQRLVQYRPCT